MTGASSNVRLRLLALLVAAPGVLASAGLTAVEAWRLARPDAALFAAPAPRSLADAIRSDEVQAAYALLRAGHDPRAGITVSDPALTGGRTIVVAPLLWAVASQSERTVPMLLGYGRPIDAATSGRAFCLAEALGNAAIAGALRPYVEDGCAVAPPAGGPLLR